MKTFTIAAGLIGAAVGAAHAQTLYGVGNYSAFGSQSLYSIDTGTGQASLIGNTGLNQIAGLDWDLVNHRLVALTVAGDIFQINPATGASTRIVDLAFGVPEGSVLVRGSTIQTVIFNNLNTLSGSGWQSVGASGLSGAADISGLEIVDSGRVVALATNAGNADSLVSFDTTTGAATTIGLTGTNSGSLGGLAYNGSLFMTDGASLFRVNTNTGVAALVGAHGFSGFSGLAIPSPGSAAILGFAALSLARRRR
jgi:hypothetical protein